MSFCLKNLVHCKSNKYFFFVVVFLRIPINGCGLCSFLFIFGLLHNLWKGFLLPLLSFILFYFFWISYFFLRFTCIFSLIQFPRILLNSYLKFTIYVILFSTKVLFCKCVSMSFYARFFFSSSIFALKCLSFG